MDKNTAVESSMRDWSADERRAFIRSIPAPKRHKANPMLGAGIPMKGLCGTDVSILDRRSVKAQLAGRWAWRVTWWNLCERLHYFFNPRATLEQVMYAFHRRHHAVTLGVTGLVCRHRDIRQVIHTEGVGAAMRYTFRARPDAEG